MNRILLITLFCIGLASQANSQVGYYTALANEYEKECSINKKKADKLDSEASNYLKLAKEYQSKADSCFLCDDDENFNKYSKLAEETNKNATLCKDMAKEARSIAAEKFSLWQDAVTRMMRARREEEEQLRRNRGF